MRYRLTSSVRAPIEKAFAFSVDPRNTGARGGVTITKWTDGEIGLCTTFRHSGPFGSYFESEIVAFDPPHSFVTEARIPKHEPERGLMSFEERDGVTYVTTEADLRLPKWLQPLEPLALAFMWPMLWIMTRVGERTARRALE
jgi:hypothetical protein